MPRGKYELKRGYRNPKFIANRQLSGDHAVALIAHPLWPGETLKRVSIKASAYASVTEGEQIEVNWRGLLIPALDIGFGLIGSQATDTAADSVSSVDTIYAQFVKGPEGDQTDQVYGGSIDEEAGPEEAVSGISDYGYIKNSVEIFFKRENMLAPLDSTNVFETFTSNGTKDYYIRQPTILLLGAHRFEVDGVDQFGLSQWNEIFESASDRTYFNLMWDPNFIEDQLAVASTIDESMTSAQAKLVQLMLGDNYHEGSGGWSMNTTNLHVKASLGILTPIKSSLIGSDPN